MQHRPPHHCQQRTTTPHSNACLPLVRIIKMSTRGGFTEILNTKWMCFSSIPSAFVVLLLLVPPCSHACPPVCSLNSRPARLFACLLLAHLPTSLSRSAVRSVVVVGLPISLQRVIRFQVKVDDRPNFRQNRFNRFSIRI